MNPMTEIFSSCVTTVMYCNVPYNPRGNRNTPRLSFWTYNSQLKTFQCMPNQDTNEYKSLELALKGWLDKDQRKLPKKLRQRISNDFFPLTWDNLAPEQRLSIAQQWDYQHNPAMEDDQDGWWDYVEHRDAIKQQIKEWENVNTPTANDLAKQEARLQELKKELTNWENLDEQSQELSEDGTDLKQAPDDLNKEDLAGSDTHTIDNHEHDIKKPNGIDDEADLPDVDSHPLAIFRAMDNLKFKEIKFRIDPEKLVLRILARGKEATTAFKEIGITKKNEITLNRQGDTFMAMANKTFNSKTPGATRTISRLSASLRDAFDTPDSPFSTSKPRFKLSIPKNKEAKRRAHKRTTSFDDSRILPGNINADADTDAFLQAKDPDYNPDDAIYSDDPDLGAGD